MVGDFNYYTLLGVTPNTPFAEMKSAYRAAVAKYHPDVNQAPNAQNLMALLNEAWAVLQDPEKKAAYDASLEAKRKPQPSSSSFAGTPAGPRGPLTEMLSCEQCGEEDPHQRFAVFYRVYSTLFSAHTRTIAARLCTHCRSREAWTSALHTALFGFWGNPGGILRSIKAMYTAIIGGDLNKKANVAMLGYLANAYAQRGKNEAALTALTACYEFQPTKGVAEAIASFKEVNIVGEEPPARLDGQIYAMACLMIPLILFAGIYTALHLYLLHMGPTYQVQTHRFLWSIRHFLDQARVSRGT